MKTKLFLIAFILLCSTLTQAQTYKGKVIDENSKPMEFVTVALYSLPDSVLITGQITDSKGEYSLNKVNANKAFLKISFVGYESQSVLANNNQIITLKPKSTQLGEVVIKAKKSAYKVQNGGIIASIKGTSLETLSSGAEIIKQLPFVISDDDSYTVLGKGAPLIYINNRLVRDNNELKQLKPKNIKDVQIITSPGAEYDASVKSIIRITTTRPVGEGLSGYLSADGRYGRLLSGSEYLSLNYRKGGIDIFGSFNDNHSRSKDNQIVTQELKFISDIYNQINKSELVSKTNLIGGTFGINFNPNTKHSTGFKYNFDKSNIDFTFDSDIQSSSKTKNDNFLFKSKSATDEWRHTLNGYYYAQLSKTLTLNISMDMLFGKTEINQESYKINSILDKILNLGNKKYNVYAGKGILSKSFGKHNVSLGSEYAYTFMNQIYKINKPDLGLQNSDNKLVQNRLAFFTSYQTQVKSWGISAGIRFENIQMDYFNNGNLVSEQSKKYGKLFPNASLSYNGKTYQLQLSYNKSVSYPTYYELRSNVQYNSPFMYEGGNPYLVPSIYNALTATLGWKNVQVMASFKSNKNEKFTLPTIFDNKDILLLRPENIKTYSDFTLGVVYSPSVSIWNSQIQAFFQKQWLTLGSPVQQFNNPQFILVCNNTFRFKDNWTIRINSMGYTSAHRKNVLVKSAWNTDVSVSKSFFNQALSIYMGVNDVFHTKRQAWNFIYNNASMSIDKNLDTRQFYITINYAFNNVRSKYKGQNATDEINRLK